MIWQCNIPCCTESFQFNWLCSTQKKSIQFPKKWEFFSLKKPMECCHNTFTSTHRQSVT